MQTTSNAQGETKYAYNADGIRTQQTKGATSTTYVVDSNQSYAQVLSEISGSNTISYTYGDDLISQSNNGQTSYYHYDGLGSTRQLSNAAGTITDSYDYQAFGKLLNQTGSTVNNYLFTGEQFDKSLDQYYLRARYYNQNTGRFTQQDTYAGSGSDPVTLHKYLYANVNPVSYTDPSGNMGLADVGAANNIVGTLSRLAYGTERLLSVIDKAETTVSLYQSRSALLRAFSYVQKNGYESTLKSDKAFANTLANYEDGLAVLGANFGKIFSGLEKSSKVKEFVKDPKNDMIIYGPTPESMHPWFPSGTRFSVGSIKIGKSNRRILLELGSGSGQGGRFIGLGHSHGTRKVGHTQWFRMDWHKADGAQQWEYGSYHFHLK